MTVDAMIIVMNIFLIFFRFAYKTTEIRYNTIRFWNYFCPGRGMKNIDMTEIMEKYLSLVSRTSYRILCDRKDSEFVTVTLFVNLSKRTDSFI